MTIFERYFIFPSASTFTIPKVKEALEKELGKGEIWEGWIDPFAGKNSKADFRNDINEEICSGGMDALLYLKHFKTASPEINGVIFDPPYTSRQVSEHYKCSGAVAAYDGQHGTWLSRLKDETNRILLPGKKVIIFGYNSNGMGKNRGYEMEKIILFHSGGTRYDIIMTVERKL